MATLTIRNVSDRVHKALRRRAAENERSVEAEVRALLESGVNDNRLDNWRHVLGDIQHRARKALAAKGAPSGWSVGDEFLMWRRLEFMREEGLLPLRDIEKFERRLEKFDLTLAEVDAALKAASR